MGTIFETEKGIEGRVWSYTDNLYASNFDNRLSEFSGILPPEAEARLMGLVGDIHRHGLEVGYKLAELEALGR